MYQYSRGLTEVITDHSRPPPTGTGRSLMTSTATNYRNYCLFDSLRLHHRLRIIKIGVKMTVLSGPNSNPNHNPNHNPIPNILTLSCP